MSVITNNTNEPKYKKPDLTTCAGAVVAGLAVRGVVNSTIPMVSGNVMQKIKVISNLSNDEFAKIEQGINTTLKDTGLSAKGVKLLKYTDKNFSNYVNKIPDEISKAISQDIEKNYKFHPKFYKKDINNTCHLLLKTGNNAFYTRKANKIIMPEKDLITAAFHELGHAANANKSTVGKLLQKSCILSLLALPIALIALIKTKKAPNEKPKDFIDEKTDFIKNNAGKLVFITYLPTLAEEAMASIKSTNFAKKVLTPSLAEKVSKTNKWGYLSYISCISLLSIGTALGVKVKDAIAKPELTYQGK